VFAAGVVLWEALTARRLLGTGSEGEMLARMRSFQPVAPSLVNPAIPAVVDELVLRALAPRREERIQSAEALVDALDPLVHLFRWSPRESARFMRTLFASSTAEVSVTPRGRSARSRARRLRRSMVWVSIAGAAAALAAGTFTLGRRLPHALVRTACIEARSTR
jgi:hypothetical protein